MKAIPFAWQDKRVLRLIREQCQEYHSALGVYFALTVIASDKESAAFQTTHQWIGQMSGLSESTVKRRLRDLASVGAVKIIAPPGIRQPCKYSLPGMGSDCRTLGNDERTIGHSERTIVHGKAAPWPTSEEKKKRRVHSKPIGTAARIGVENQIKILKARLVTLQGETSEQWQREAHPELVTEKRELAAEIKSLEDSLL